MKIETIHKRASELVQNGEVAGRINLYKKEFTKNLDIASQITVERQLKVIQSVLNPLIKKSQNGSILDDKEIKSLIKLIQEQNKLLGLYPSTKLDVKNEVEVNPIDRINKVLKAIEDAKQNLKR